jgi:hypothetical protein
LRVLLQTRGACTRDQTRNVGRRGERARGADLKGNEDDEGRDQVG